MLKLPRPPSTNSLYFNRARGRTKTKAYNAWIAEASVAIYRQKPPPLTGVVSVTIRVEKKGKAKEDIDNRIKAVLDVLVKMHVINDDRMVWRVTAEWADVEGCEVEVAGFNTSPISIQENDDGK
jgi:crossover junction endodeoxyribonuclease RusA